MQEIAVSLKDEGGSEMLSRTRKKGEGERIRGGGQSNSIDRMSQTGAHVCSVCREKEKMEGGACQQSIGGEERLEIIQ